jgi:hypothetical protein
MEEKKPQNPPKNYGCKLCDYYTSNKKDYNLHLLTSKHKKHAEGSIGENNNPQIYNCICGKVCKTHGGIWKHKQKCNKINNTENNDSFQKNLNEKSEVIDLLLKENKFFKNFIIEQNEEFKNLILEIVKKDTTQNNIINNNITHTNSHNKAFNLNFFLNETCKNAMNITDFVDSIKLQLADLENVGKIGYVEGLSNIIIKSLNNMDVTERPVHCSDSKRDTIYVKDENKWEKENDDHKKVIKAIEDIANKNTKLICEWKKQNPECSSSKSVKADQYSHILIEALCSNNDTNNQKVLKKLAKEVIIDKNILV